MSQVSVYIIAYNEAEKIQAAVHSVLWADEIIVVDSHSTDDTVQIAESLGVKVVQVDFKGFGDLRNRAMSACSHEWIFSLDSDERCTPEARDEILEIVRADKGADAYYVPRRNFFMGQWIKHSGFYPDYRQPQLFRKGALVFKQDMVHEAYSINSSRKPGFLRHAIWQVPFKNMEEVMHKANKYSTLGAIKLAENGKEATMGKALARGGWSFFKLYFLKRGILDGWPGFVIALGNFEGTFYRYAKLHELKSQWRMPESPPLSK
ncbi:MAG: glycosyltransferase family 2 protein [Proteobacteria bacterium]|jgi:glycosyltransferase involved in cell wall biosynthesis|nr:glycosyltransferase family 2 protein [Desulfocapsa sp.]MBU3944435.1 glycosyltransferase family 2 protein [Pseudomonadota bacterium]MCG2744308.1 glycosyltransferase family 2 protein [Desulfobacteraceae bacterium]MBU3984358.1 glycosyltransferase family 2 protein [Pseudomonadota bacterium]MBU4028724.1 glycosyltransferase family 2 protein [Pseudomonadota bacterium]